MVEFSNISGTAVSRKDEKAKMPAWAMDVS